MGGSNAPDCLLPLQQSDGQCFPCPGCPPRGLPSRGTQLGSASAWLHHPQNAGMLRLFGHVPLFVTPGTVPTRLLCPWDSPGKNTGVGCRFLLQCLKVKSESEVAQSCLTPSDPMGCSPPGSSIHGIFQARVLKWGAIAFSDILLKLPKIRTLLISIITNYFCHFYFI